RRTTFAPAPSTPTTGLGAIHVVDEVFGDTAEGVDDAQPAARTAVTAASTIGAVRPLRRTPHVTLNGNTASCSLSSTAATSFAAATLPWGSAPSRSAIGESIAQRVGRTARYVEIPARREDDDGTRFVDAPARRCCRRGRC